MSVQNPLPISVIQMSYVEKIAEVAQNQPQVQQEVGQEIMRKELQRNASQVAATEKTNSAKKVGVEKDAPQSRQQQQEKDAKNSLSDEKLADLSPTDPFSGKIIDLEV